MSNQLAVDVVVVGGGIAGLWCLHALRQQQYQAILLETNTLGGGQTVHSQGIIHGGLKYALDGRLKGAVSALTQMPTRWQRCLQQAGDLDLSAAKILSTSQLMWARGSVTAKMLSFFASRALASHVQSVPLAARTGLFQQAVFKGQLYQLNEMVLDVPSVVQSLATALQPYCVKLDASAQFSQCATGEWHIDAQVAVQPLHIKSRYLVLTAGRANRDLALTPPVPVSMQQRPLHMVLCRHPDLPVLYGHGLNSNFSATPKVTISTHFDNSGTPVWYLGGELAEANGVARAPADQIKAAQACLQQQFPQLPLQAAQWRTVRINRAEYQRADGRKPDGATWHHRAGLSYGWPTKLALAPDLADQLRTHLQQVAMAPRTTPVSLTHLPHPKVAQPIWSEFACSPVTL